LLHLWTDGEGLHAQVSDGGVIDSVMAGRLAPPPEPVHGRGLWIINQLCDLVQIRSPESGTTVRVTMHRPRPPG
jgi:anti-sigma regulatory factor (Ser/Thr protein kinase)